MEKHGEIQLEEVMEGAGKFIVPLPPNTKGPAKRSGDIFYNPSMQFDRDMSIIVMSSLLSGLSRQNPMVLDALCASGIRGLRYSIEIPIMVPESSPSITLNDVSPEAVHVANKNALLNCQDVTITNEKAQAIMHRERFDVIDIDPYGSAVPFLDAGINGTRHGGILAFTATDTAVACGTYGRTCKRRYQAAGLKNHLCHETGLRIMMGHAVRRAAENDIAIHPLLCYYSDHYFRIYARIDRSRHSASKQLEKISFGVYHRDTGEVELLKGEPCTSLPVTKNSQTFGPFWSGRLLDDNALERITVFSQHRHVSSMRNAERILKLIKLWNEEARMPPFFYETADVGRRMAKSSPTISAILNGLRDSGHIASRTHFTPTGIKTDATSGEFMRIFSNPS